MIKQGTIFEFKKQKMSRNFFQECLKLTIAMDLRLKDPIEKKKLEKARNDIMNVINKNFPDMVDEYYKDI